MALKVFLNAIPEERAEALVQFIPEEERNRLALLPRFLREKEPPFALERVHWSWWVPTLKSYGVKDYRWFILSLEPSAREALGFALKSPLPTSSISCLGRAFLRQLLLNSLLPKGQSLLPIDCLPPSRIKRLLQLSKKGLVNLVDFLSLYDLSLEIRQIVDTKALKTVYSILSEEKRKFLRQIADRRDPFPAARLGLDRWDGQAESLRLLLHRRGLARLAGALADQEFDFVWYVAHQFDMGRGHLLLKLSEEAIAPAIVEAIQHQIAVLLDLVEVA